MSDHVPHAITERVKCPECGPHGGLGKVALLYSWVDCLTCHPPVGTASSYHEPLCGCGYPYIFMVMRVHSCPNQPYSRPGKPQQWHSYSTRYECPYCMQGEPSNPELVELCMRCSAESAVCCLCGTSASQSPCVACLARSPHDHVGFLVFRCTQEQAIRWQQGDRSFYKPAASSPARNWHELVTQTELLAHLWEVPT